jgi:hypothetical protein
VCATVSEVEPVPALFAYLTAPVVRVAKPDVLLLFVKVMVGATVAVRVSFALVVLAAVIGTASKPESAAEVAKVIVFEPEEEGFVSCVLATVMIILLPATIGVVHALVGTEMVNTVVPLKAAPKVCPDEGEAAIVAVVSVPLVAP